jgi:hypothetical protein
VPAYLVAGELFLGRQHRPMVEWLEHGVGARVID